jgi:hypothetical protein
MERLELILVYIIPDAPPDASAAPVTATFCTGQKTQGPKAIGTGKADPDTVKRTFQPEPPSAASTAGQPFAISLARIGLSTNSASATTTKFMIAVMTKTMCQLPVEDLMRLATGTRNAEAPLAV